MSQPIVSIPQCDVKRATPFFSAPPGHSKPGPGKKCEVSTDRPVPLLWLTKHDCGVREAHVTLSLNGRFYIGDDPIPYELTEDEGDFATLVHAGEEEYGHCRVMLPSRCYWDLYEWYEDYVPPILFFLGDTLTADLLARRVHFGSAESAQVFAREYPQWVVTHE